MAHLMTDGRPCARADGHAYQHRSAESMERRRAYAALPVRVVLNTVGRYIRRLAADPNMRKHA